MREPRRLLSFSFFLLALVIFTVVIQVVQRPALAATNSEGSLQIIQAGKPAGFCPLRHTDVKAGISGFIARVVITQEFANPSTDKIEAVYTFPLPQNAAVDDMTIQIGTRTIRGMIKRREEAAAIYAKAIQQGHTAALLDQERPNIFTQTVGNIPPGEAIRVTIAYVARLKYEDGGYEFVFPMVVGPRYIPGSKAVGHAGNGWAPDTDKVPDASRITPPIAPPGTRAGHDISIALALDAGVPIQELRSPSHKIDVQRTSATSAIVQLRNAAEIPNKDFILRYDVAGTTIAEGLLTHTEPLSAKLVNVSAIGNATQTNGYFSLVIQPPERFPEFDVTPKELVFVLDSSGSMNGFPEEKSKRLIDYAIEGLYPGDTFNIIKFSGDTAVLFDQPVYPTADNVRRAKDFVDSSWGGGGTEMMKAIRAALAPSDSADHVRIVVFLTDGFVGNDMEIIGEIQKHANARVFAYGIGSSVNRFLLDKMAEAGRGAVEYVSQKQDDKEAEAAAHRLYERLRAPLLTDISLDFGSLPVTDVYPRHIPDLFSAQPVVITGRYTAAAKGTIHLTAKRAGDLYSRDIPVALPGQDQGNNVLASLWAREKIDDLMSQDWAGLQNGNMQPKLRTEITQLGLDYRLMTQFTSFVAVEERVVTDGGKPKRVEVPVELPEDVRYEGGVIGGLISSPSNGTGSGGGIGSGTGPGVGPGHSGGYGGGVYRVGGGVTAPLAIYAPMPQYSDEARKANLKGTVILYAIVGTDGRTHDVRVARALGMGLDEKALEAVRMWKYEPAMKDGKPVAIQLGIEVNFMDGASSIDVTQTSGDIGSTTPAQPHARNVDAKLHPKLVAAYDCWQGQIDKAKALSACRLTSDKLVVEVILSQDSSTAMDQLKAIGFEPLPSARQRGQLIGRIPIAQLQALASNSIVKFVAPISSEPDRIDRPK